MAYDEVGTACLPALINTALRGAAMSKSGIADSAATDVPEVDVDPFCDAFLTNPHQYHAQLRDVGPLFRMPTYGIFGMARYAEVSAALKDCETFCSGRGVGLSDFAQEAPWRPPSLLLETDPPTHNRTRKIMTAIVSNEALKKIRPIWREKAESLVEALVTRKQFDAVRDLAEVYPISVFPDVIGLKENGRENLLPYAAATFNAFGPRNALFENAHREAAAAVVWVNEACRRDSLKAGGWGMAVYEAVERGECTELEAERLVRSFLSAGVDTTINGLANMLYAFSLFPEQWSRLREDPALSKRAIEESLRWSSTVQTFFRTTTRAVEIVDKVIPEGSKVLLFLASANRDPRRWHDPDRFDITRQAGAHVGFGYGIHRCLGQMVARLEAELILDAFLSRVASMRIAGGVEHRLNNTLHAVSSLPLEVTLASV
jgi:4-methoxybenzoate monooxygenase (O-demethylating)